MNALQVLLFPILPTRRQLETQFGHDPAKLARLSAAVWRLFRAVAVGSVVGWLVIAGTLAGLAWAGLIPADDRQFALRLGTATSALFGAAVLVNYPWQFCEQGSRWVRWLVLAVGVPSAVAFVGLFFV